MHAWNQPSKHDRISQRLAGYATYLGYRLAIFPISDHDIQPDVHRTSAEGRYLACLDAKDSDNETVSRAETTNRIDGYAARFFGQLARWEYLGGIFGIATDDPHDANDWRAFLDWTAAQHGRPDARFRVGKLDAGTFLIWGEFRAPPDPFLKIRLETLQANAPHKALGLARE